MDQQSKSEHAPSSPSIALALGGGGARGIAHIHVIEVLDELGLRPKMIAGSSIGAIMGAAMAAGMRGTDIRSHTLTAISRRGELMNRLWRLRPASFVEAVKGGLGLGRFNLERVLDAFLPDAIPRDFADLAIPLKIMATDYYGQSEHVCARGDLRQAIAASAAIPALFRPVKIDGRVMIDGGVYNPVPFDHLHGKADIVIGVDVVGGPEGDGKTLPSRIDSLFGSGQLMMQSIIAMKLRAHPPDIFLRPEVNRFRVLDFLRAEEVLTATAGVRDDLKRALEAAIEARLKSR
ncbi:NTE family protein [Pararhizobium capsulatum DSM 1112]|uniref:NTE family protein n=1 Tax=Pararhizobium capsulatum DSM 1112 TaxID=1121113 RepID=A0ABU0BM53_9HYPH|nr:patatin-like phospholipase family protein [Pararhizobium capsulatum]MDQ0319323.1 NTE family protein [Pararhizobium capsulatum DSM 1112]